MTLPAPAARRPSAALLWVLLAAMGAGPLFNYGVSASSTVVIELIEASPTFGVVWCDGRRSAELRSGMEIEVRQGQHKLRLARLSEAPFTDRLVNKFGLRVEGWRGAAEAERESLLQPQRAWSSP